MAKTNKIKEQIDYQGRPERMDPNLERKLKDPESLYGKNPAMKKGVADVQRLVSARFLKVAEKLREVRGYENLNPRVIQNIYNEEMSKLPTIMAIEARNRERLEELAIQAAMDETEIPEGWVKIDANLNRQAIDTSNFRYEPEEEPEESEEERQERLANFSFDVEDLTPEEELELEKHKRNIINALIQGAAKKGHYAFQKPEIKEQLNAIDPRLYPAYLGVMAVNDMLYFTMEQAIEMMSQTGHGVAGKVELDPGGGDDDDEGGYEGGDDDDEGGENEIDTVIRAEGIIFPILCHEIIKGIEESKGRHGHSQNPDIREKVRGQVDILSNEPMQLRIGPEIYEKLREALPSEMVSESNKGLINWFQILLYQIPAKEFLEVIGNAISENPSNVKKATQRFYEIMKEAKQMKEEFESYKEENGSDSEYDSDDEDIDDDDLDDFLGGFGISRPK
jgi:hypothetical protein